MTAFPKQIIPPNSRIQWASKEGVITTPALQFIQQMWNFIAGMNPVLPCTATHVLNTYLLSTFPLPPTANSFSDYADYNIFTFVSPFTSTGPVIAQVNDLAALPVYIDGGVTPADAGDVVNTALYLLIYNSNLGGFVLK